MHCLGATAQSQQVKLPHNRFWLLFPHTHLQLHVSYVFAAVQRGAQAGPQLRAHGRHVPAPASVGGQWGGEQNGLLVVIGMVKGALLFFAARGEAAAGFRAGGGQDAAGSGWAGHCWAEEKNDKLGRVLRMVGVREGRRC